MSLNSNHNWKSTQPTTVEQNLHEVESGRHSDQVSKVVDLLISNHNIPSNIAHSFGEYESKATSQEEKQNVAFVKECWQNGEVTYELTDNNEIFINVHQLAGTPIHASISNEFLSFDGIDESYISARNSRVDRFCKFEKDDNMKRLYLRYIETDEWKNDIDQRFAERGLKYGWPVLKKIYDAIPGNENSKCKTIHLLTGIMGLISMGEGIGACLALGSEIALIEYLDTTPVSLVGVKDCLTKV